MPARAEGGYAVPQGRLVLKQQFQVLSGTLTTEGRTLAVDGKVRGNDISFTAGGKTYQGRMNGTRLEMR